MSHKNETGQFQYDSNDHGETQMGCHSMTHFFHILSYKVMSLLLYDLFSFTRKL